MDPQKKRALAERHQALRTGIIVANFRPELRKLLTEVEYSRINFKDKTENVSAVDALIDTLLTKTDKEFDLFCQILRANGYEHWARELEVSAKPGLPMTDKSLVTVTPKRAEEHMWDGNLLDVKQDLISCDMSVFESGGNRHDAIRALFCNAFFLLDRILRRACRTTTYLADFKEAALHHVKTRKMDVDVEILEQADAPRKIFQSLGVDEQWSNLSFLDVAVMCLPDEADGEKITARAVLKHYRSHLRAYTRATSINHRNAAMTVSHCEIAGDDLVGMEITVDKDIEEYSCEDCVTLGNRFFGVNLDCVQYCSARPGSTILVFKVPKTLVREIEEKLSKPVVQWMMKELGIHRVRAPGMFDKDMTGAISTDSIRAGLESGVDFISLTEHCSPLMKSLVNFQDMTLMDEGKYTGGFFRELTQTERVVPVSRGKAAHQHGELSSRAAHMGRHSTLAAALGPAAVPKTSDTQSRKLLQLVKHPLRDWRRLGECQNVIKHSPEGGLYWAMAVNSQGLLAVTDGGNKCVHLLTKEGVLVRSIGKGVLGDVLPGVAFDLKGNAWVTDNGNTTVVKLSQDGRLLLTIYHAGSDSDCFTYPHGVSVSPEGLIYICDSGNCRVTVHDEKGKFLFAFGSRGSGPGCFDRPHDIEFSSDGLLYVADEGNKRVCVLSKEGTFKRDFKTKYDPYYIAAASDNHLLITSTYSHTVMAYTLEGELVHQFGRYGTYFGRFNLPRGICVDDSGLVYVVDGANKRIQGF